MKHPLKYIFLVLLIFQFCQDTKGQQLKKFNLFLGFGFYEGFNIGSEYQFKTDTQSVNMSVGWIRSLKYNQKGFSLALEYNYAVFRNCKNIQNQFNWYIDNRVVFWQLEDDYYSWETISLIPSLKRNCAVSKKLWISLDIGPSFNIVLFNKRKTFREVGWPYHIMPNARLLFNFKI